MPYPADLITSWKKKMKPLSCSMLPEEMFSSLIATDLKDKITTATEADELTTKIKDCLQKQLPLPMRTALSDWSLTDSLIIYKGKIYVLTNMEL